MKAAMPCKTSLCRSSREPCRAIGGPKTKYACIDEADEYMRIRMEGAPHRGHEDPIAGNGMNSMTRYSLVHNFVPMPQAIKFQMQRKQWRKMGKTREDTSMAAKPK